MLYKEGFTQNRELSWLRFNERCLDEAADPSVPLLERLQFIRIFTSNLDEFFMVRVGSLLDMRFVDGDTIDPVSGMTPNEQLRAIYAAVPELYRKKDFYFTTLMRELGRQGVRRLEISELSEEEREKLHAYFREELRFRLNPVIFSSAQDFPELRNKSAYLTAVLTGENDRYYLLVEMPNSAGSGIPVRKTKRELDYILTEDVIFEYLEELALPFAVEKKTRIRVTRNAEIKAPDENSDLPENFRMQMQQLVRKRAHQEAVRLEFAPRAPEDLIHTLCEALQLERNQCFCTHTSPDLSFLSFLKYNIPESTLNDLRYPPFEPAEMKNPYDEKIMELVREKDIFSAYPYDSMSPLLRLLEEAAGEPHVREIRMTIYRLADHARIAEYLARAAENGKKVRVLIELRARFDEENNIEWSKKLESAGCRIYYGGGDGEGELEGYKVHCKICQIVLDQMGEKRYITQVGTGNYNESTARQYTDFSLITYNQKLGKDVSRFFRNICKGKYHETYKRILAAPSGLKPEILRLIDRETQKKERGRIFIKVNSITDTDVIDRLSTASNAGVRIRMIVRGICCILPGVEYCTENIEIVNVVGRYLEHSRVYIFGSRKEKDEVLYISSADLMTRNTENRVELAFPVYSRKIRRKIKKILKWNYLDNVKGRRIGADGRYYMKPQGEKRVDSQEILMRKAGRRE